MPPRRETTYDVRVWGIDARPGKRRTSYRLRWSTAGKSHAASFATKALAESKRAELMTAARRGEAFDVETGLPVSQVPDPNVTLSWWDWVLTYADTKWPTLAPNSRRSMVEALIDSTMTMLIENRGRPLDVELRAAMWRWAFHAPHRAAGGPPEDLASAVNWLARSTRPLRDLQDAATARAVLQAIAVKKDGTPAAPTTIARKRALLYNVLELAVEREHFPANPFDRIKWKAPKVNDVFDPRAVVNPDQARALLAAVGNLPDSGDDDAARGNLAASGRRLVAFFGCMYYSALRPSEVVALGVDDLELPDQNAEEGDGWGQLYVSRSNAEIAGRWADGGRRQSRQLKHRAAGHVRVVPCPPPLVELLRRHLREWPPAADGRLFAGPRGGNPLNQTYSAVWQAARNAALTPKEIQAGLAARPYDLRHTAVSTWLAAGVDSVQVAEWAGHSVAVLHRVYAHVLSGRGDKARRQIDRALGMT